VAVAITSSRLLVFTTRAAPWRIRTKQELEVKMRQHLPQGL
jgi:hypothetical protein